MKNLKVLRKENNLSLKELGIILGIAESTVSLYENEKREPDNKMLIKIANFFNVSVDYLLGRTEDRQNRPVYNVLSSKKEENELSLSDSEKALILSLRRHENGKALIKAVFLMIGELRSVDEILREKRA